MKLTSVIFFLGFVTVAGAQILESEPNNTPAQANVITSGVGISGQLSTAADVDVFTIIVSAPTILTVGFTPETANHTVTVTNSNGVILTSATASSISGPIPLTNAANAGTYYVTVRTAAVSSTRQYTLTVTAQNSQPTPVPKLINLSILTNVAAGESITAGFVIEGGSKRVLIRAIGPSLTAFGVAGVMSDPRLFVFNASRVSVAGNDNWQSADAETMRRVGGFDLPFSSRDAAVVTTLAAGNYTVQVSGSIGTGGNVLLEVYEVPNP